MLGRRVKITVKGKVQGVWYRQSTLETANALGIRGWVRNLPNGDVEILAEGETEAINSLIEWCKKGPPLAIVKDIEIVELSYIGNLPDFHIKR